MSGSGVWGSQISSTSGYGVSSPSGSGGNLDTSNTSTSDVVNTNTVPIGSTTGIVDTLAMGGNDTGSFAEIVEDNPALLVVAGLMIVGVVFLLFWLF